MTKEVIPLDPNPTEEVQPPKSKTVALIQPTGFGGFNNKEIAILRTTSFSECKTLDEVAVACCVARKYDLDPFAKEIWAMRMKGDKLMIEASASGWRKIVRRQPKFKRMVLEAWYPNDEIEFDLLNGKVTKHMQNPNNSEDKDPTPVGAYCFVEYEDGTTNLDRALWSEYGKDAIGKTAQGKTYETVWKYKREMIKNKAAAIFGRTYCEISGVYAEGEVLGAIEIPQADIVGDKKKNMTKRKKMTLIPDKK